MSSSVPVGVVCDDHTMATTPSDDASEQVRPKVTKSVTGPRRRSHPTRGRVIGNGMAWTAKHSLRIILITIAAWIAAWVIGKLWTILLPIAIALIVCTVLWPPVRWLRSKGVAPAAAAGLVLVLALLVVAGVISAIAPSVVDQSTDLANQATEGVEKVQEWLHGPPFRFSEDQLNDGVDAITSRIQDSSATIASGVFSGVTAATSVLITLFTVIFLVFFFLKDGPRFVPCSAGRAASRSPSTSQR